MEKKNKSVSGPKPKKAAMPVMDGGRREIAMLAVGDIKPAGWNVHKAEDAKGDEFMGLVRSIRANGMIHRILVRRAPDGGYEIIDGHRRREAAIAAGLQEVPCEIVTAGDNDAKVLTATANVQRIENDPFLEAALVESLRKKGMGMREIAGRLGKSEAYVLRRARLLELTEAWRDFASRVPCSLDLLEKVAAHGKDIQNMVAANCGIDGIDTPDGAAMAWVNFESAFREAMMSLDGAAFDIGPCAKCPSNTANCGTLFPWLSDEAAMCQNRQCFAERWNDALDRRLAAIRRRGRPAIMVSDRWHVPEYWNATEVECAGKPQAYVYSGMNGLNKIVWSVPPPKKEAEDPEAKAARRAEAATLRAAAAAASRIRGAFIGMGREKIGDAVLSAITESRGCAAAAAGYFADLASSGTATTGECAAMVKVLGGVNAFAREFLGDEAAFTDAERAALFGGGGDGAE